jgi:SSS family solute:Na+ symporter
MGTLDWIITVIPLGLVLAAAVYCNRYIRTVADFVSGGRVAGRYLLAISAGEIQAGAGTIVANFEILAKSGFSLMWWGWITIPVGVIISVSGFVIYRYRETRAMTLAQFFEIRYSKRFRIFAGALGFLAGILNFGIIPAVGTRCVAYFWELPDTFSVFSWQIPSFVPLMALSLCVTVSLALSGGVITVMIVNCMEGIVTQLFYLIIIAALLCMFNWSEIASVLESPSPGHSLMNPFDSNSVQDFNIWYVLMGSVLGVYGTMAWQNTSAYRSAALTPHESRMGGILGYWRGMGKTALITLLGVCALAYLNHPHFAGQAIEVKTVVGKIKDPQIQEQMLIPIAASHLLPTGIKGVLSAVFLMGLFGGDSTALHSWGSIFVQDILVPLRKKPFGPKQHIRILRWSIVGVGLFAFVFGSLYRQTDYIAMWWTITISIYVGGAGAAIIGGLYWKKGTTAGAWSALIAGSLLSGVGILAKQFYPTLPFNLIQASFATMIVAVAIYVIISLLTCKSDFNMDRMLHRGEYCVRPLHDDARAQVPQLNWRHRLMGLDENFSRSDKWIAAILLGWSFFWCFVFFAGTAWNFIAPWSLSVWSIFWEVVAVGLPIFFAVVTGIWFTWGGLRDTKDLFRRLRHEKFNDLDDGTVVNHRNLDEVEPAKTGTA